MTSADHATVAVLGGGPAGASAALELTRLGIDTTLVEQTDGSGSPVGECLAPSANPLLQQLGLSDVLPASGAIRSYGNRSSWGGDGAVTDRDFLREPFGHGWHLDRPAFNRALLDTVEAAGVSVWRHHRVTSVERTTGIWQITTAAPEGENALRATMLVDATGRHALLARHQRLRRRTLDSQIAAVAFLAPDSRAAPLRDATTVIEAVPDGWWYVALLPNQHLVVACFTDPDLLAQHAAWRPTNWWNLLRTTDLVGPLVTAHGYEIPRHIDIFPAGSSLLTQPTGDAAAAYDPLSSHGIGSALASGRSAARALAATLAGDPTAFPTYRDRLLAAYTHYLCTRHAYYADEPRWPTSPFWRRRHGTAQPLPAQNDS
ncbi:MAG TPA: FAD-dependent oxidoreductase [Thermomicrobiales bacterium]|nr:FAD-dependent oxidoreductase [Thermomicrobiales bacterium]